MGVSVSRVHLHLDGWEQPKGVSGGRDTHAPSFYVQRHETIDVVDTYHEHTLHVGFRIAKKKKNVRTRVDLEETWSRWTRVPGGKSPGTRRKKIENGPVDPKENDKVRRCFWKERRKWSERVGIQDRRYGA